MAEAVKHLSGDEEAGYRLALRLSDTHEHVGLDFWPTSVGYWGPGWRQEWLAEMQWLAGIINCHLGERRLFGFRTRLERWLRCSDERSHTAYCQCHHWSAALCQGPPDRQGQWCRPACCWARALHGLATTVRHGQGSSIVYSYCFPVLLTPDGLPCGCLHCRRLLSPSTLSLQQCQ